MGRDDFDPQFQRTSENTWVLIGSIDHRYGHLATGMAEERETRGRHASPELVILGKRAVHVLAVREKFERPGTRRQAAVQLLQGIFAPGMD